ncbi:mrna export factor elf1 [Moniliophthora roreri]|nr:mrna export factor elf1 [Moniliophthora roreri]
MYSPSLQRWSGKSREEFSSFDRPWDIVVVVEGVCRLKKCRSFRRFNDVVSNHHHRSSCANRNDQNASVSLTAHPRQKARSGALGTWTVNVLNSRAVLSALHRSQGVEKTQRQRSRGISSIVRRRGGFPFTYSGPIVRVCKERIRGEIERGWARLERRIKNSVGKERGKENVLAVGHWGVAGYEEHDSLLHVDHRCLWLLKNRRFDPECSAPHNLADSLHFPNASLPCHEAAGLLNMNPVDMGTSIHAHASRYHLHPLRPAPSSYSTN